MFTCCQNHIFIARDCACTCARDSCRQGIERVCKALRFHLVSREWPEGGQGVCVSDQRSLHWTNGARAIQTVT